MKPAFNEPWQVIGDNLCGHEKALGALGQPFADRAAACVNACVGMENPAAEIARLRALAGIGPAAEPAPAADWPASFAEAAYRFGAI